MAPAPRTRYSADLDPGGFTDPDEAAHRATRAVSAMKLGLLLEGQVPVLSQNQVFDSPLFLAWAGADDDETSALARLIRGNWIQVRIHGSEPGDSEPRLAAAAARALADERFLLSGWPGISREEREEAAAILSGRSHLPPSGTFAPQIRGVQLLDEALRASSATERAVVVVVSLAALVRAEMDQRAGDHGRGRYLARPFDDLMALAERIADGEVFELDGEPVSDLDLNRRSDWRRLSDSWPTGPSRAFTPSTVLSAAWGRWWTWPTTRRSHGRAPRNASARWPSTRPCAKWWPRTPTRWAWRPRSRGSPSDPPSGG